MAPPGADRPGRAAARAPGRGRSATGSGSRRAAPGGPAPRRRARPRRGAARAAPSPETTPSRGDTPPAGTAARPGPGGWLPVLRQRPRKPARRTPGGTGPEAAAGRGRTAGPGRAGPGRAGPTREPATGQHGRRRGATGAACPGRARPGRSPGERRRAGCARAPPRRPARPGRSRSSPAWSSPAEAEEPPAARRRPPPAVLAEAWALARKHPLEAVSVILLGVGGLILPFPFWLIGGLVALRSRRWDARDKWIALAGPPLVTFAVLLIRAGTSPGNFFSAFYHASQHDVGLEHPGRLRAVRGVSRLAAAARPADADASPLAASPLTYAGRDR